MNTYIHTLHSHTLNRKAKDAEMIANYLKKKNTQAEAEKVNYSLIMYYW